jgi:hypothetical protein
MLAQDEIIQKEPRTTTTTKLEIIEKKPRRTLPIGCFAKVGTFSDPVYLEQS